MIEREVLLEVGLRRELELAVGALQGVGHATMFP